VSVRRLRLFLDANILHAAALRDFLLRLAEAGVVDVRWSEPVLEETRRSLEDRGFPAHKVDRLVNALRTAFPEAEVRDFEVLIPEMTCPDQDDRHVLAAAVAGEADILVTDNTDDFPADTGERYDVAIITGDELAESLVRADPETAARVGRAQIADLINPPSTEKEFLERLARTAPRLAMALGAAFGIESWAQPQSD
jgi:predicted nucleic acid-binding protein